MALPVVLLSGFLGAGKTTLLRELLRHKGESRVGVVLNEVGLAGIDTGLSGNVSDAVASAFAEIAESCACCVQSDDFNAAMQQLAARGDLDLAIFETTGMADPLPIIWRLQQDALASLVRLDCVVTVLDPTGAEAWRHDEWRAQAQAADWLVVAKEELATPVQIAALREAVAAVNRNARFIARDAVAETLFAGELNVDVDRPVLNRPMHGKLRGVVVAEPRPLSLTAVEDLFDALPPEVYRAKAIVRCDDGTWAMVQRVAGRLHTQLDVPAPAHGESRFACFGAPVGGAAHVAALDERGLAALVQTCCRS